MEEYTNKKRFPVKKFFLIALLILNVLAIGLIVAAGITYLLEEHQVTVDKQKQQALYANILDGISTKPEELTVDFSHSISTGSPLIFGGNHGPLQTQNTAWGKIQQVGVTSMRSDIFLDLILPKNITLNDYKNNVNNVQDPKNWNWEGINELKGTFQNAKSRGMTTIGILSSIPFWLSDSNTQYGVPKDWDVYQDIIKKTYSIFRDDLDYVEVWNEPSYDLFLNLKGSNLTREDAYKNIFKYTTEAIREVDANVNDGKKVKIGGPVTYIASETSLLDTILKDPNTRKQLDFVSYHSYDKQNTLDPSDQYFLTVLKKYNLQNIPIFITEWNYDPQWIHPNKYNDTNAAIPYVGNKFISFLQMGIQGANYYTIESVDTKKPNQGKGTYAFFKMNGNNVNLLPQASVWELLSQKLGLGKGVSKIYNTIRNEVLSDKSATSLNTIGFKNVYGDEGIILVNASASAQLVTINTTKLDLDPYVKANIYYASSNNNAESAVYSGIIKSSHNNIKEFSAYIPSQSVVGIIFSNEKEWYNLLDLPINNIIK